MVKDDWFIDNFIYIYNLLIKSSIWTLVYSLIEKVETMN